MKIKIFLVLALFYNFLICDSSQEKFGESWHFNTEILRNHKLTKEKLLKEGFEQVEFTNEYDQKIVGLLLKRENAKTTIIFTHGFCPGGKEKFAPFAEIAPKYCNLLFIDLIGYGDSPGPNLLSKLKNYGKDNYKDIVGAIKFVNQHKDTKDLPIILFGWCSGGFHSATALITLKDKVTELNIKGLILDSGFGAVEEISDIPMYHIKNSYIPGLFSKYYGGNKKRAQKSYVSRFTAFFVTPFLRIIELFIKPSIAKREPETNLYNKVQNLQTPVWIIHNKDDTYAKWENTQKLINKLPYNELHELWLIEKGLSTHANNHLKLKEDYKEKMLEWTNRILL